MWRDKATLFGKLAKKATISETQSFLFKENRYSFKDVEFSILDIYHGLAASLELTTVLMARL